MQKRKARVKKLTLHRETLVNVAETDLGRAVGAISLASSCDVGDGKPECIITADGGC